MPGMPGAAVHWPKGRILLKTVGVVDVFVACRASIDRLSQQIRQGELRVLLTNRLVLADEFAQRQKCSSWRSTICFLGCEVGDNHAQSSSGESGNALVWREISNRRGKCVLETFPRSGFSIVTYPQILL